jgi:hypothetical protein
MGFFEEKHTNILGDSEVAGRNPDAEGDFYHITDAAADMNYWHEKNVDLIRSIMDDPTQEYVVLWGGLVSDSGSGQIDISEGMAIGKNSDGEKRLIHIPALTNIDIPSGWDDGRQIWVTLQYDFKLGALTRVHRVGVSYHYQIQDTYLGDTDGEETTSTDDLFTDSDPTGSAVVLGSFTMTGTTYAELSAEERSKTFSQLTGSKIIGSTIKTELSYIPISSSHPWLCMSLSDRTLNLANYNQAFIDALRARKLTYDEFGASPVTAFTGAWGAGADANKFTLDNNATNIAMLAELAEDWLFASSPVTGWRILGSGGFEFNITGITTATRIITVNLDSESPAGATSIEIYLNRVYRDATKVRHFSEAGNAAYQAGGTSKFNGLRRRDQFQAWQLGSTADGTGARNYWSYNANRDDLGGSDVAANYSNPRSITTGQGLSNMLKAMNDGTNGDPRTGLETRAKSGTRYEYVYTGSYTA